MSSGQLDWVLAWLKMLRLSFEMLPPSVLELLWQETPLWWSEGLYFPVLMDFYPNSPLGVVPLTVPSCDSWGSPELLFQLGLSRLGESWKRLCKRLMEFFKLPGPLSSMHSSWFSCKCASNCYSSLTDNCTPSFTSKVTTCLKTLGSDWERKFFFSLFYIYA